MNSITLGEAKALHHRGRRSCAAPARRGRFLPGARTLGRRRDQPPPDRLRGTHVAGGSAVWIVGGYDYMTARGFTPLGMEPLAVGLSADADHIITPSKEGSRGR